MSPAMSRVCLPRCLGLAYLRWFVRWEAWSRYRPGQRWHSNPRLRSPAAASVSTATLPYGPPVTLDQAKRAMAAAELEAMKNSLQVAIAILDSGGNMVMFHKIDNTQLSASEGAEGKARTVAAIQAPEQGARRRHRRGRRRHAVLALKDITPLEGGIPLVANGVIVGAIGVSGALSAQDAQVAKAGADTLAKPGM